MTIQRYLPTTIGTSFTGMKPAVEGGDYVLFTDHTAEVERLTAERDAAVKRLNYHESQHKSVTKSLHAIMGQRQQLATERDAAIVRAVRAEEALRRVIREVGVVIEYARDAHRKAETATILGEKIQESTRAILAGHAPATPVVDAEEHDKMLRDLYDDATPTVQDAPDKPHYATLSPEPWGGPDGEDE